MEALDAAEASCLPFLSRETLPAVPRAPVPIKSAPASVSAPTPPLIEPRHTRHTRQRPLNDLARPARSSNAKLLFLQITNTSPPTLAKLACPDCARSNFPSVQGLLNHCRLRHSRDFGSHDECIRNCAVSVPEEEQEWVMQNGIELGEVSLPSLRSLFEIAVGGSRTEVPSAPDDDGERENPEPERIVGSAVIGSSSKTSTHLSKTLGLHIDTPALAPFLGLSHAPKRRCINVLDQGKFVDILDDVGNTISDNVSPMHVRGPRWRMPYTHRSKARASLDIALHSEIAEHSEAPDRAHPPPSIPPSLSFDPSASAAGSRFHIIARVAVTDRSFWLPSSECFRCISYCQPHFPA